MAELRGSLKYRHQVLRADLQNLPLFFSCLAWKKVPSEALYDVTVLSKIIVAMWVRSGNRYGTSKRRTPMTGENCRPKPSFISVT